MGGASLDDIKSATLDHIITWNFSNDDTAEMPAPKSTVHWLGARANDHALISCTIDEQLLSCQDPWEQSVGQIRIHYSKPIAEILSSAHRAPWTQARMWTIQGHEAFENAQGLGGRHCPLLPQAMSIKNKGVLRVGVPYLSYIIQFFRSGH